MNEDDFIKQLLSVTNTFELVSRSALNKDLSDVEPQILSNILSRSKAAVARVSGIESEYYKDIEKVINAETGRFSHLHQKVLGVIGSVYALKDDISNGYVLKTVNSSTVDRAVMSNTIAANNLVATAKSVQVKLEKKPTIVEHDELFQLKQLLEEVKVLENAADGVLGKVKSIKGTARFLILGIWGEQSNYIKELDKISFTYPTSFDRNYVTTDSFNKGKELLESQLSIVVRHLEYSRNKTTLQHIDGDSKAMDFEKVFIVHGHDVTAKTEAARFIEKLGFSPIVLHEQTSEGKTIIEKIEAYSNVGFGVILYTPCDLGGTIGQEGLLQNRARQNVVFEHGYLIGKLGRGRVCALVKGELETPNDISGIVFVRMDENYAWCLRVAKEMKAAGYPVDMNRL